MKPPAFSRIAPPKASEADILARNFSLSCVLGRVTISRALASVLVSPGWSVSQSKTAVRKLAAASLQ